MQKWKSKEFFMNNRRYRHRLLALSASILLGLSSLSSSAVDAAEVTVEQPAADTRFLRTREIHPQTPMKRQKVRPKAKRRNRNESNRMPTLSQSSPTTPPTGHRGLPYGQNQPLSWIWTAGLSSIPKTWMSQSIRPVSPRFSPH